MANLDTSFSEGYIEECFIAFYTAGRPKSGNRIRDILPVDDRGRKPSKEMILKWKSGYNWDIRADELDVQAYERTNEFLIEKRTEMLKRQATDAFNLQKKALDQLLGDGEENIGGFDSSAAAVNAYFRSVELEQQTTGISDMILRMSKLTPDQLKKELTAMVRRAADSGQIIDVPAEELENTEEKKENDDMSE